MTSGQTVSRSTDPVPPYSRGCVTQPRGTGPASWVSARGTRGDAASGGLSGARSSPGGVGAELQPLADPGGAPGAECRACDPPGEAQGELDLVPWVPCPAPSTRVPGAQVSSLTVLGGISQPSPQGARGESGSGWTSRRGRPGLHGPQHPQACSVWGGAADPRGPATPPPGHTGPHGSAPPWPADPCLPAQSCAGPCATLFPSRPL